jgi:adhesin/invasin
MLLPLLGACGGGGGGGSSGPAASASTIELQPAGPVVADGSRCSITVTVRDAKGNRLAGQTVQVLASGSKNDLEQVVKTTIGDGRVFATLASTKAEDKEVTAIVGTGANAVTLSAHPIATFIGDAANLSGASSKVTATPEALVADGASMSILRVVVRDVHGNGVPDLSVELGATGSQNVLGQPAGPTTTESRGTPASTKRGRP